ncbi:hypothetical protein EIP86_010009 [Pleurotus ostreatoroseus]|nr:hypothetical protein EIP86_010009 [Pleurotus ostreatoroseus]
MPGEGDGSSYAIDGRTDVVEPSGSRDPCIDPGIDAEPRTEGSDRDEDAVVKIGGRVGEETDRSKGECGDGLLSTERESQPPTVHPVWWNQVSHSVRHNPTHWLDGLVGCQTQDGKYLVTSPTVPWIPEPYFGNISSTLHADGHYGAADPVHHPQVLQEDTRYRWIAAVQRRPNSNSRDGVMWAPLIRHHDFGAFPGSPTGLGTVRSAFLDRIRPFVQLACDYVTAFLKRFPPQRELTFLYDNFIHSRDRLTFPATYRDLVQEWACTRRFWLYVVAWLDWHVWVTRYFPLPPDEYRRVDARRCMGCFTTSLIIVDHLAKVGAPVWFMRTMDEIRGDERIASYTTFIPPVKCLSFGDDEEQLLENQQDFAGRISVVSLAGDIHIDWISHQSLRKLDKESRPVPNNFQPAWTFGLPGIVSKLSSSFESLYGVSPEDAIVDNTAVLDLAQAIQQPGSSVRHVAVPQANTGHARSVVPPSVATGVPEPTSPSPRSPRSLEASGHARSVVPPSVATGVPEPTSPSPRSPRSLEASLPGPSRRAKSKRTRHHPYSMPGLLSGKKTTLSEKERSRFLDFTHPLMPPAIPEWQSALVAVSKSKLIRPSPAWKYWLPEARIVIGSPTDRRQLRYLCNWLRIRVAWLSALSSMSPTSSLTRSLRAQEWREVLNTESTPTTADEHTKGKGAAQSKGKGADQRQAVRATAHQIIHSITGVDILAVDVPDRWLDRSVAELQSEPNTVLDATLINTVQLLAWELHDVAFRIELRELDIALVPAEDESEQRLELLDAIVSPVSALDRSVVPAADEGLSHTDCKVRAVFLDAFCQLMRRWPTVPSILRDNPSFTLISSPDVFAKLEHAVYVYYCSTFFQVAGRPPVVPRRIP